MSEYLLYMLIPTIASAALLYLLWIMRFSLQGRLSRAWLFVFVLSLLMYFGSEPAVCALKPWVFDCSRTLGFCPCGLPIEDLLFSFLVVLNVTMAALAFSEMERRSKSTREFLEYFLLLKKPKTGLPLTKEKNKTSPTSSCS